MTFSKVFVLCFCFWAVANVAAEGEFDKDVEIISGKEVPQQHPLDAKYAGHAVYPNEIYGPSVSLRKKKEE